MNATNSQPLHAATVNVERRRHTRFRLSVPISVSLESGKKISGMTIEISEGGLSAVLAEPVPIGATVTLNPVAQGSVKVQVRRKIGKIHGFEFLNITNEQTEKIRQLCGNLPLYPNSNKMGL